MKTSNSKKRFVLSLVVTIVSIAMLVGATFAWFTDSVTSGMNKIIAGNLDIELEYTTDGTTWNPVTENTKLFGNDTDLWEPGYTKVAYLKLSNKGNLALKYNLSVNVENEVEGTNVDGQAFKLSDYINMGVDEDWSGTVYADRASARAAVSEAGKISTYTKFGSMTADAEAITFAIVVYMPETVGNEANPKTGTTPPSIELGVSVVATQLNSERDSFDDTYDFNAEYPNGSSPIMNVGSAESLKKAITEFVGGSSIVLDQDIDLKNENWDTTAPWAASGTELVFDGNGHTIKNLKTEGDNGGLFGKLNSNGNITIKNLTIENIDLDGTNVDGESGGGALIGWSEVYGGTLTIENVTITNVNIKDFKYIGGLVGYTSAENNLNIKNCSVNGTKLDSTYNESGNYKGHVGGVIGYYTAGTMSNCAVSNLTIVGSTTANRAGALIGTAQTGVVVGTGNRVHSVTINNTAVTAGTQIIGSVDNRTDKATDVTID